MSNLPTWWRGLGSLKAFVLAFALLFAPVAEAFACGPEASHAAAEQQVNVATSDADGGSHGTVQDGVCQHGHCHHGGSLIAPQLTDAAVQTAILAQTAPPTCGPLMSRAASRLERPPRA